MKIIYNGKEKTFLSSLEANRFMGVHIPGMLYSRVTPELYYKFDRHEFWDDESEMTGEEWAKVATELLISN
jgi:hypothetical protein